ncbi:[acyl-carrier-protein] S-malonyltransferase [Sporosarcina sp. P37]|uniref:ACP S-malonyltransferase n=1 Tax=unclassified Sporosarcina TaxID=2647733 RepID=UPI000A17B576|nr:MULTISPECIES: ACP S-malonyltransferase [unclassified Sporosarcina]ARK25738.1 [acyl-carrier-protein] S-malonyltransferase [Sporosarcina sp. P37]PID19238.1 [acyl-carrier-protein] S-malonyltransferase [Sporosarcina sp. P35]
MSKLAFVFPGQGSQVVGMGKEFTEKNETCRQFMQKADKALGFELSKLMLEGPQEELTLTYNAQPALLTAGAMIAARLEQEGIVPDYSAGHSLGEYTALVESKVLSFEDAVVAVHKRGLYMNEAVPAGQGAMAAILGIDRDVLESITQNITESGHPVQAANLNCPGQIVISGAKAGVDKACTSLKEAGAKRALPLNVSGPFHSVLMQPAAEELQKTLEDITMKDAEIPVIANVTADEVTKQEEIKKLLVEQLYSPVRWEESVEKLLELGVTRFVECGPGKVLSGLIRKIDRTATVYPVYDEETLEKFLEEAKGWS